MNYAECYSYNWTCVINCLPLIIFYQIINKSLKSYILYVVILYLIWFATYSVLHELCHIFGSWITGAKIKDYQLIPRFLKGDYKTGYVNSVFENGFQSFISQIFPYFRDLIFLFIGYIVLKRKKITNTFLTGLVLILFVLSPLYDVFNNYFAFVLGAKNDFSAIKGTIGNFGTHTIGLFLTLTGIFVLWRVFVIYKKQSGLVGFTNSFWRENPHLFIGIVAEI